MHLYLSGPMTGIEHLNYPAFRAAAESLRAAGYQVTNPAEKDVPIESPWIVHMRADIKAMMECDGLAILQGWESSKGANVEITLAHGLGMPVHGLVAWLALAKPSKAEPGQEERPA